MEITTAAELNIELAEMKNSSKILGDQLRTLRNAFKGNFAEKETHGVPVEEQPAYLPMDKYLGAVIARESGRHTDIVNRTIDEMQEKTATKALTGSPLVIDATTGSFLIPETYRNDIIALLTTTSELRPRVTTIPMVSNSMKYPAKNAGISFTRVSSDSAALTEVSPTFQEVDLDVETFALWISVTENFIDDNLAAIGAYFRSIVAEGYVESFDTSMLNNAANPTGLLQNSSVNTVTMNSGDTTFSSITIDDLYSLVEALTTGVKRRGAAFIMHPLVWDIVRMLKNADGDPLLAPWSEAMSRKVFGYDVILSDEMPSTSATATAFIAFGNPALLLYGDRLGLELKYYGDTVQGVQHQEVFFRARYRAAYAASVPGAFSILKTAA